MAAASMPVRCPTGLPLSTFAVKGHSGMDSSVPCRAWPAQTAHEPLLSTLPLQPRTAVLNLLVAPTVGTESDVESLPRLLSSLASCDAFSDNQSRKDDFEDSPRDHVIAQLELLGAIPDSNGSKACESSAMCARPSQEKQRQKCGGRGHGSAAKGSKRDWGAANGTRLAPENTLASAMSAASQVSDDAGGAKFSAEEWPDTSTTVMVRNIPNRYTAEEMLAEMLSKGFENTFDFFYLPIDFNTKRNRGYGFVNFKTAAHAKSFVTIFNRYHLSRYSTKKILEVLPAITQGFEANVAQYVRKDSQRIQNPWFRPMIFPKEDASVEVASTDTTTVAYEAPMEKSLN